MGVKIIDRRERQRFIWLEEAPNFDGLSISPSYEWGGKEERKPYTLVLRPEVVLQIAKAFESLSPIQVTRTVLLDKGDSGSSHQESVIVHLIGGRDRDDYLLSLSPTDYDPYIVKIRAADAMAYGELLRNYAYDLFNRCIKARKTRLQLRGYLNERAASESQQEVSGEQ